MSRLSTSFVLGYHGCDARVGRRAVHDGATILKSERDFDWLGPGAYFWQSDPVRAREWADWKVERGDYETAAVVGAVIDLGNCLDLTTRGDVELVRSAYYSFAEFNLRAGLSMPSNRSSRGHPDEDRTLRFLDCAVIRHLHGLIRAMSGREPFDTVRGMFQEGGDAYPGSGFGLKSHVQIAVLNPDCIKGVFHCHDQA